MQSPRTQPTLYCQKYAKHPADGHHRNKYEKSSNPRYYNIVKLIKHTADKLQTDIMPYPLANCNSLMLLSTLVTWIHAQDSLY